MRQCILAAIVFCLPVLADAANLVGDADNNGAVEMADAALVQSRVLDAVNESVISPLALADNDGDLDLKDLLLVAQASNAVGTINGPGAWLALTPPADVTVPAGDPAVDMEWSVASGYPAVAALTDGMTGALALVPGTVESTLLPASVTVAGQTASGSLTPLNTTGSDDNFVASLTMTVLDSSGSNPVDSVSNANVTVQFVAVCGDGIVTPPETCEGGMTNFTTVAYEPNNMIFYPDMAVANGRAYVVDQLEGILVYDISGDNWTLESTQTPAVSAYGIAVQGNRAYVAEGYLGVEVYDITVSPPANVGASSYSSADAVDTFPNGNRLYVADGSSGLRVLDISTDTPVMVGEYLISSGYFQKVFVSGNRAYVAASVAGMFVLDITTDTPALIGSYDTPGGATDVVVFGDRAAVADAWTSGLLLFDISGNTPVLLDTAYSASGFYRVFHSGSRLFAGVDGGGLEAYSYAGDTWSKVGGTGYLYQNYAIAISGNRAYMNSAGNGFYIFDISEDCSPTCVNACGDGVVTVGEACDEGPDNGAGPGFCLADCSGYEP